MESEKQYAMFIHLSQLAGSIVVGLGWILPLVLWLTKKDSSEYIFRCQRLFGRSMPDARKHP